MKKLLITLLICTSSGSWAADLIANNKDTDGFYLGAGVGSFQYTTDQEWDNDNHYGKLIEQTDGNTFKVYAGYQFNRVIAVEATYSDYGDTQGYVYTFFANKTAVEQSPSSFSVAANAGYTFTNGLRPFALLGLAYMDLNSSTAFLDTDNPIAIKYGFGLEYAPAALKGIQLRVAYEADSYLAEARNGWASEANVDVFTLNSFYAGLSYKF